MTYSKSQMALPGFEVIVDDAEKRRRLAAIFVGVNSRCRNTRHKAFRYYGGKGVKNRFESVQEFIEWALENGYFLGATLDRIDNDGHYCRENCRWVSRSENSRAMIASMRASGAPPRGEWLLLSNGELLIDACFRLGFSYAKAQKRVDLLGASPDAALLPDQLFRNAQKLERLRISSTGIFRRTGARGFILDMLGAQYSSKCFGRVVQRRREVIEAARSAVASALLNILDQGGEAAKVKGKVDAKQ